MAEQVIIESAADGGATTGGTTLTASADHTVATENHSRDKLIMTADVADIWVSLGTAAAVLNQGIRVKAGGAPYELSGWKGEVHCISSGWKGEVHCISSGAAVLGVTETSFQLGDREGEAPAGASTFSPSGPSDARIAAPTAPAPGTPQPPQPH